MTLIPQIRALVWFMFVATLSSAASAQILIPRPGVRPVDSIARATKNMPLANIDAIQALTPADSSFKTNARAIRVSADSTKSAVDARQKMLTSFKKLKAAVVNNGAWCNAPDSGGASRNGLEWCHFYSSTTEATKAAKTFWKGTPNGGTDVEFGRMVKLVGNQNAQSTKVELLSDLWNTMRVSLSGVLATKASKDSVVGDEEKKQSKAQQFLNGGGPASLVVERPFFVLNFVGTNTILLGRADASFTSPGANKDSPADSMQFATTGLRVQSRIDGGEKKISGVANMSVSRAYGGRTFYRAVTGDTTKRSAFGAAAFSVGLVLEERVQLTWSKIFFGPRTLQQGGSFFTVNVTR